MHIEPFNATNVVSSGRYDRDDEVWHGERL